MPLIRLSGEAFRRHTRVFRARGGLQDVKEIEANRLLDLYGAALCAIFPDIFDVEIAAAPEIVQVLLLGGEQLLEPLVHYAIQRPLSAAADFFSRGGVGGMVDHVFGELDWTAGPRLDCEGNLAKVPGMDGLVGVRTRGLDRIVPWHTSGSSGSFRSHGTARCDGLWNSWLADGAPDLKRLWSGADHRRCGRSVHSSPSPKRSLGRLQR